MVFEVEPDITYSAAMATPVPTALTAVAHPVRDNKERPIMRA
jgi:hypothetical protein